MALTSLDTLKNFLNVATDAQDAWLEGLRLAAEAAVKSYTKRDLEYQNYVEYYSGNGRFDLPLRNVPVTAVNNVWVDATGQFGQNPQGAFPDTTLLAAGTDYTLDLDRNGVSQSGILYRLRTYWYQTPRLYIPGRVALETGPAFGNVKVDYNAGFTVIPQDLQLAVALLVSACRRNAPQGGPVEAEKIGQYSYELSRFPYGRSGEDPPEFATVRQMLARYRHPAW